MKVWKFLVWGRFCAVAIAETAEQARRVLEAHALEGNLGTAWLDDPALVITAYECSQPSWVSWVSP